MLALVAAVDFLGYATNRVLGSRRGALLTGLVGGLVSSTIVTVTMSRQAKEDPALVGPGQVAVLLACAVMGIRVGVLAAVVGGMALARPLLLPVAAMVVVLLLSAGYIYRSGRAQVLEDEIPFRNPFHLKRALIWGLALSGVLLVSAAARAAFGDRGLYVAAAFSGLADVDPITLAVSSQIHTVSLPLLSAVTSIILAVGANTLAKAGFAWISGGRAFGARLTMLLAASLVAALLAVWVQV
jgi:uncharacterized membrane protein (DUF4010 family)